MINNYYNAMLRVRVKYQKEVCFTDSIKNMNMSMRRIFSICILLKMLPTILHYCGYTFPTGLLLLSLFHQIIILYNCLSQFLSQELLRSQQCFYLYFSNLNLWQFEGYSFSTTHSRAFLLNDVQQNPKFCAQYLYRVFVFKVGHADSTRYGTFMLIAANQFNLQKR